jgi:hypothetical protein
MAQVLMVDHGCQGDAQAVPLIPVPSLTVPSPILVGRPCQTDYLGVESPTQTEARKTYEISV